MPGCLCVKHVEQCKGVDFMLSISYNVLGTFLATTTHIYLRICLVFICVYQYVALCLFIRQSCSRALSGAVLEA